MREEIYSSIYLYLYILLLVPYNKLGTYNNFYRFPLQRSLYLEGDDLISYMISVNLYQRPISMK